MMIRSAGLADVLETTLLGVREAFAKSDRRQWNIRSLSGGCRHIE